MIKKLSLFIFLLTSFFVNAQETTAPQMADGMRAEGKIYVVITVMTVIFLCVAAYLIIIDRKVKKLEDELKNKK
jgi:heme/copper-type cytochrome/quinol oxidase subunit 2